MNRSFADTLRLLLQSKKGLLKRNGSINATQAAREIKIHQPTLSRMLNDQSEEPAPDNAEKLKKYFNVTYDQLTGKEPIPGIDDRSNFSLTSQPVNTVPLISFVAAGDMCEAVDPYPVGAAERMVNSPVDVSPGMYALEVRGDSMKNPVGIPNPLRRVFYCLQFVQLFLYQKIYTPAY